MKNFLNGYTKFMDVLEKILRWILGISMAVMVAVIFYQVILRYVFHNSNIWSEELARYLMCYAVLFGAAIAVRKGSHLQVDFLINMLPERARCIAVTLGNQDPDGLCLRLPADRGSADDPCVSRGHPQGTRKVQ